MRSQLDIVNRELSKHHHQLRSVISMVKNAGSPDQVADLRARMEAIKAWARTHKQVKHLRLDLLRIEIAALVRMVELGGLDQLSSTEAECAQYLAGLSESEREQIITEGGNATTATGLVRSWRKGKEEVRRFRHETQEWVSRFSSDTPYPEYSESKLQETRSEYGWYKMRSNLQDIVDSYTELEEPFTIQDVVDQFTDEIDDPQFIEDHPELKAGLKEVARKAVYSAPPEMWGDTVIPKTITTLIPDGEEFVYIRVPVMVAKVCDVEQMVKLREEQLKQDEAALSKLRAFHSKLLNNAASADANVGEILLKGVESHAA